MQILGLGKVYIFIQKGDGKWHLPEIKEALSAEPTRMSFGLMNKIRPEFNSGEKKKEKPLGESVTPSGIDGIKSLRINILNFTLPLLPAMYKPSPRGG